MVKMRIRLKNLITALEINQKEFSDRIGVTSSAITQFMKGQSKGLNSDTLQAIVKKFHVNPTWLLTGEGEMFLPKRGLSVGDREPESKPRTDPQNKEIRQKLDIIKEELGALTELFFDEKTTSKRSVRPKNWRDDDFVEVPLVGEIAAGSPIVAKQNFERMLCFPSYILKHRGPYFALRVRGDSMIGAHIFSGDIAILSQVTNPEDQVKNGDVVAALIEGEATLKRIYFRNDHVELCAENPNFPPINLEPAKLSAIQGCLIGTWRYWNDGDEV